MVVKKISKKVSEKKVIKKKVSKVSSSDFSVQGFEPIDRDSIIEDLINDITDDDTRRKFVEGIGHYFRSKDKAENGEFRGDVTRDTFDSSNRFSKVLLQQGRVQLDADWNEQTSITAHQIRNLACDIGSEHWGPHKGSGFALSTVDDSDIGFYISPGHYYVNGVLCEVGLDESGKFITYASQPDYPLPDDQTVDAIKSRLEEGEAKALAYLDVWERHYNYINEDTLREVALGGPDTATRAKTIWQVKILILSAELFEGSNDVANILKETYPAFLKVIESETKPGSGKLCAKVNDKKGDETDPCLIEPDSRYRGNENQLYRVEIHKSGVAEGYTENSGLGNATFKWSRENASVFFPITDIQSNLISLEHLGKDCRYGLKPNDWVEVIDDDSVLQCRADKLLQVKSIDTENRTVTLNEASEMISIFDESKHSYLRRWDHADDDENGIAVIANSDTEKWFDLEDGVQVQFKGIKEEVLRDVSDGIEIPAFYKTGDYWLIPARTITGDIEWPRDKDGKARCIPAQGVQHHYAPLALFDGGNSSDGNGEPTDADVDGDEDVDLRRILKQAWE
jgi:hypothetical protein